MKSKNKLTTMKLLASVVVYSLFSLGSIILGQAMPQINVRFSNPQFDKESKMYFLDAELKSRDSKEFLFGMNVRFFYDASLLEFKKLDQFNKGYALLGDSPKAIQANGQGGIQMFNLKEATTFVNGAIQLQDDQTPLEIVPDSWVKAFRVCFKVPLIFQDKKDFCPSVLWDLKPQAGTGGFLTGDDGLVLTVLENDPNTPDISAPAQVICTNSNWEAQVSDGMPFGKPVSNNCISLVNPTYEGNGSISHTKYELFQNEPNPFNSITVIHFIIPTAQQVTLKFYDISGKILSEIKGDYAAGNNSVTLDHQPWMEEPKIVFYLMETEGFRSEMLRMTIISK